jgi:hypothetical protein
MNRQPQRPLLGFLWPQPDRDAGVDEDYRQVRMIRVPGRGWARLVGLVIASVGLVTLAGSALLAGLGAGLLITTLNSSVIASATLALLRGWAVGTYVNDAGFVVRRFWSTRSGRWSAVSDLLVEHDRVLIVLAGEPIPTTLSRWSVDILGSESRFHQAVDVLGRWLRQE